MRSRAVLLRAMEIVDSNGNKTLAELVADAAIANPLMFLEKLSRYLPKDMNINQTTTVQMVDLLNLFWSAREGRELVHGNQIPPVVQRSSDEAHDKDSITH